MTHKFLKLPLIAATVLLASCSSEEDIPAIPTTPSENAIAFSTYVGNNQSRGEIATLATLQNSEDGFGVYAYYEPGKSWSDLLVPPSFMFNQQVTFNGAAWKYSPVKYWPASPNEKISFFAYAPRISKEDMSLNVGNSQGISNIAASQYLKGPKLSVHLGGDISTHKDILYASAIDQTNTSGQISFEFKHAMARLGFKVTAWEGAGDYDDNTTVTINAVTLNTTRNNDSFDVATGKWGGSASGGADVGFVLAGKHLQNNVIKASDVQGKQLNTEDGYMMMVPDSHHLENHVYWTRYCLLVDYTIETIDPSLPSGKIVTRNKIYRYIQPIFEAGKAYTINIHLGMSGSSGSQDDGDDTKNPDDPDPIDPNPDDNTEPSTPGNGGNISFTSTVTDWGTSTNETNLPIK